MPKLGKMQKREMPVAADDVLRNPDGVFSGPSLRVARSDGTFAPIEGMPKDSRNRAPLSKNYR